VACQEEALGRGCLEAAQKICLAAWHDSGVDLPDIIVQLRNLYDTVCLGPSTRAIVRAANDRGIPARRLIDRRSLVQLGHGARQRRIMTAETDRTGALAETISQDKELTKWLLRAVGVPVPEGRPADSPADAWQAAQDIVPPVVVKPRNGNHGRGVFTNLSTRDEIDAAYAIAVQEGDGVLVERYIPGYEHRLLVVGNRVVAAARGEPAAIVGDGRHTVTELVEEQINSDPRRGDDYACPLSKIDYDSATRLLLKRQGFTTESVVPAGTTVLIQQNGNLAFDVTDRVHPEVEARAVEAARAVGLDIAGVDLVIEDIGRPMEEQRAAVVEVNAGPGLQMHLQPSVGTPRPVGEAIVATLFERDENGRIPVVAVLGGLAGDPVARLLGRTLQGVYTQVGLTLADGVYAQARRINANPCSQPEAIRSVLMNPGIDAAVFSLCPGRVVHEGLGLDECDVAVIVERTPLNPANEANADLLLDDPLIAERTLIESVRPHGTVVLPADDEALIELAKSRAVEIVLYSRDAGPDIAAISAALASRER
jgi:cyanophycin synthetase